VSRGRPEPGEALAKDPLTFAQYWWSWYARVGSNQRRGFYLVETLALVLAALVTLSGALGWSQDWPPTLGAILLVITGLRQVCQFRDGWISASSAQVEITTQVARFNARAGAYRDTDAGALLVARVTQIIELETKSFRDRRLEADTERDDETGTDSSD
jgi:hypothetical protein